MIIGIFIITILMLIQSFLIVLLLSSITTDCGRIVKIIKAMYAKENHIEIGVRNKPEC